VDPDNIGIDSVPIRTYPRTNVYLSEDFVLLVPSEYCRGILKQREVSPQTTQGSMTQAWNLHQYPRLQR
jgi:hypothetical protein